jgi:hypothetical protein
VANCSAPSGRCARLLPQEEKNLALVVDDAGKFLATQGVRVSVKLNDTLDRFTGLFKTDFIGADGQVVASTSGTVQGTRIQVEPAA